LRRKLIIENLSELDIAVIMMMAFGFGDRTVGAGIGHHHGGEKAHYGAAKAIRRTAKW